MPNPMFPNLQTSLPNTMLNGASQPGFFGAGGGFQQFGTGLRSITRAAAAGFAKDPRYREMAAQQIAYEQQTQQEEAAQLRRTIIEQSFKDMQFLSEQIAGMGSAKIPPSISKLIEKTGVNLGRAIGDPEYGKHMIDRIKAFADMPSVAAEVKMEQFYNPETQESRAFNVNDPQAIQEAQATGFTSLGGRETSDVMSEAAMAQKMQLAEAGKSPGTVVNINPLAPTGARQTALQEGIAGNIGNLTQMTQFLTDLEKLHGTANWQIQLASKYGGAVRNAIGVDLGEVLTGENLDDLQRVVTQTQAFIGASVRAITSDESGRYSDQDRAKAEAAAAAAAGGDVGQMRTAVSELKRMEESAEARNRVLLKGEDPRTDSGKVSYAKALQAVDPSLDEYEAMRRAIIELDGVDPGDLHP